MSRYREGYFGNCPVCGKTDGYLNISCNHWFICHQHKTKWFAGSSVFSRWQFETEIDWLENAVLLGQYKDVEPVPARTEKQFKRMVSNRDVGPSRWGARPARKQKEAVRNLLHQKLWEKYRHGELNDGKRLASELTSEILDTPTSEPLTHSDTMTDKDLHALLNRRRILVIDDEPTVRQSCARIFNERDYDVETAASAREGLERSSRGYFDCALIDLKMPDMDGMEIVRCVRKNRENMVVVIITGYGTDASTAEARQLGVSDYLHKPFAPEELVGAVERALGDHNRN
ncbi:MAG: response regulator [Sedimentisphaerales bacterium]|nr:response regulator [Sedimentisphaerales bacterium]